MTPLKILLLAAFLAMARAFPQDQSAGGGDTNGNNSTGGNNGNDNGDSSALTTPGGIVTVSQDPNPPQIPALDCGSFKCTTDIQEGNNNEEGNPMVVRSRIANSTNCRDYPPVAPRSCQYRDSVSTNMCFGVYCLHVEAGNEYCICPPDLVGYQCTTLKPGSCDTATGILPGTSQSYPNKRFRQRQRPNTGAVYARHFASSGTDCIRMCQWTRGRCRSVNYGPINGIQVCELLSTVVTNGSIMEPWLLDSPGWTYTTVTGIAAAV